MKTRALTAQENEALKAAERSAFEQFRGKFEQFCDAMTEYKNKNGLISTKNGVRAVAA